MLQGQDLASGNLTAPALFALQSDCGPALQDLIESEFIEEGDLQQAIDLTHRGGGVAAAKRLAREEADMVSQQWVCQQWVCFDIWSSYWTWSAILSCLLCCVC